MNKGNKYLGRNTRRFSASALSLCGSSDSVSNVSVSSAFSGLARQTRTNSVSENYPKFWLGFRPSTSESESVVSDDTINNCDDICDTNDDEIEVDEKENDRVESRMTGEDEDCSVVSLGSLGEGEGGGGEEDNNNNLVLRDISNAPGN